MSIHLNLHQARQLLEFFGGEDAEVTLNDTQLNMHSGPGLYAWIKEHPEEGSIKLDREPHPAVAPADPFAVSAALRLLIADDAYAMTFQTFGQYRTALLRAIDAAAAAAGVALPETTAMQFKLIDAKNALQNAAQYAPPEVAEVYRRRALEVAEIVSALAHGVAPSDGGVTDAG
jgi:hypothetical protein